MKGHLTAFCDFGILKTSKVERGCSAPRQSGEKGDCSLRRVSAPEMCPPARAAAVRLTVDNLRRFFASEIQIKRRYFMAQEEPADLVNEAMAIVYFLHEAMDALLHHTLKNHDSFNDETPFGLYLIFQSVEDRLEKALNIMIPDGGK